MKHKKSAFFMIALSAIASMVFLLICSLSTTPLLQYAPGQDSAFFRLVGVGMTKGLLPYRDFFDMKGPYLFWIQYLGQLISPGRLGIFLLQWLAMSVSVFFFLRCLGLADERCPLWGCLLVLLPLGYVMSYTMTGGNLTEEWSMPFLSVCLYLFLCWLCKAKTRQAEAQDHPIWAGFFYGAVFGIMALIRVTNAALVGGILLTVTCDLIVWKRWKNLLANAGMFLLGVIAGLLPGVLWCLAKGILGEMLSQVFFFGFAYSGESGLLDSLYTMGPVRWCLLLPLLPLIPLVLFREKDWRCWLFFAASAFTTVLAALMGNGYCHYFVLAIPNLVFAAFLFAEEHPKARGGVKRLICLALVLAVLAAQWPLFRPRALEEVRYAMYCALTHTEDREDFDAVQAIVNRIPEGKTAYVYGFPSCSAFYIQAGLLPPNKYCDWQPHYIQLDPEIGHEIESYLRSGDADFVVTPLEETEPEQIRAVLEEKYGSVYTAGNYRLWKTK